LLVFGEGKRDWWELAGFGTDSIGCYLAVCLNEILLYTKCEYSQI
jgi:hypothetical protein